MEIFHEMELQNSNLFIIWKKIFYLYFKVRHTKHLIVLLKYISIFVSILKQFGAFFFKNGVSVYEMESKYLILLFY